MAKLRHIAISVPDVAKASAFYQKAFGMNKVGETHGPIADGHYLSDGTVNLAILHFKMEKAVGEGKGLDWFGVHHIGFWVDDVAAQRKRIEKAGGKWYMGEVKGAGFYEVKFTDPFGNMVDISHNGWGGAVKDGPAPAGAKPRAKRVTKARRVIGTKAPARKAPARKTAAKRTVTRRTVAGKAPAKRG
jgi:methylmalonyl-CoA/ethylmalonyl-CoA epimerase